MTGLSQILKERISSGLRRKSVTTCSRWAENYRYMPSKDGPTLWSFKNFPWLREMHDADGELLIGQKSAQVGYTENCMNNCYYNMDVHGHSALYILPSEGDASDFSTSRFDPALEISPHLQAMFSNVKNIGHKRAGGSSLFVRGSRSKSKLKSLPVARIYGDEVDEMVIENITLAFERMSGQSDRQAWLISTPTISGKGINKYFEASTMEHFFFNCPCCNKMTELIFPECLVITGEDPNDPKLMDSYIVCKECNGTIQHAAKPDIFAKGQWVPSHSNRLSRGFHINQLYSCLLDPWKIGQLWLQAQTNPTDEQEFYNSKMGVTHAVKGAQLTEADVEECFGGYTKKKASAGKFTTMGVDIGTWIHYEIDEFIMSDAQATSDINLITNCRVLTEGKVKNFEELDQLMDDYNIVSCIIDRHPETRKAIEFANRYQGRVLLCVYGRGLNGKNININEDEYKVTVDRTSWLDVSLGRYRAGTIKLPIDVSMEYKSHMTAPVRVYKRDQDGNPVGYYDNTKDDHFAHARNYAEIALQVSASMGASRNIASPI